MRDFIIRGYKRSDRISILDIAADSFAGVCLDENVEKQSGVAGRSWREHKKDSIDYDLINNPCLTLVAEAGGEIAGFACSRFYRDRSTGHITNLAVKRQYRRMSIGRSLIEESLELLRREGARRVRIETLEQNEAGRMLYPSLGFREIGRQIFYLKEL